MRAVKILERILYAIPIMLGVAIIVFVSVRLTPGDPVDIMMGQGGAISTGEIEQLRSEFHLDQPIATQLWYFLRDAGQGDLGYSYIKKQSVGKLIKDRLPATIELAAGALIFALAVAFPIGIVSAVRQNSWLDRLSMGTAFLGISMPSFWLGIVLILIFGVWLHWLPVQGRIDPNIDLDTITGFYALDSIVTQNWEALKSTIAHLILPAITLGAAVAAIVARVLRSSMLETLQRPHSHGNSGGPAVGRIAWRQYDC
jgi:peptide/nickel transport system permease protein